MVPMSFGHIVCEMKMVTSIPQRVNIRIHTKTMISRVYRQSGKNVSCLSSTPTPECTEFSLFDR